MLRHGPPSRRSAASFSAWCGSSGTLRMRWRSSPKPPAAVSSVGKRRSSSPNGWSGGPSCSSPAAPTAARQRADLAQADVPAELVSRARPGDVVLTLGAGSITEVGSITPNAALSEYATGPGDYTLNGTEDELVSVLTMLGKSPEMVGNLNMDVSLNANNGNFLGGDSTESVEVTLTLLIFQPSGMTPTG